MGIWSWFSGSEIEPPPNAQSVGQMAPQSTAAIQQHLARAMRDKQFQTRVAARIERLVPSLTPELAMKASMGTTAKLVAGIMSGWNRTAWEKNICDMLHNSPPMKFAPGEAGAVCRLVENDLRRLFGWPIEIRDPMERQDTLYVNADTGAIVWIMSRGEDRLAIIGALLTSQFLAAMQEGWTARDLQQPERSGMIGVSIRPGEISDQESRHLARTLRAIMRPIDDEEIRAMMEELLSFFERGRFRIDRAPDSLPRHGDSVLVWRP